MNVNQLPSGAPNSSKETIVEEERGRVEKLIELRRIFVTKYFGQAALNILSNLHNIYLEDLLTGASTPQIKVNAPLNPLRAYKIAVLASKRHVTEMVNIFPEEDHPAIWSFLGELGINPPASQPSAESLLTPDPTL